MSFLYLDFKNSLHIPMELEKLTDSLIYTGLVLLGGLMVYLKTNKNSTSAKSLTGNFFQRTEIFHILRHI